MKNRSNKLKILKKVLEVPQNLREGKIARKIYNYKIPSI
jgi:hypothetical protein